MSRSVKEALIEDVQDRPELAPATRAVYLRGAKVAGDAFIRAGAQSIEDLRTGHFAAIRDELAEDYNPRTMARLGATVRRLALNIGDEEAFKLWSDSAFFERDDANKPLNPLTDRQTRLLIDCTKASSLRDVIIVKLAITTGARVTEIVGLDRKDVTPPGVVEYRNVRAGQYPRRSVLDEEGSDLMNSYLDTIDDNPPLLRSWVNRKSPGARLTRQGVWLILGGYSGTVGEEITPRRLRDSFVYNFKGDASNLSRAIGVNSHHASVLIRRRHQTKL